VVFCWLKIAPIQSCLFQATIRYSLPPSVVIAIELFLIGIRFKNFVQHSRIPKTLDQGITALPLWMLKGCDPKIRG
jgi:hypothetical protein